MRLNFAKWILISAAVTIAAAAMLPTAPSLHVPNAPVLELFDNEIPNPILDGIFELGGDVAAFLRRMMPF